MKINKTRLLHHDAGPETYGFLKWLVFGLWLWIIVTDRFTQFAVMPYSNYHATGLLLRIIPDGAMQVFFTVPALVMFKTVLLGSVICVLCGRYRKPAAVLVILMLTLHQGLIRSFGYINHAQIALLYSAYVICFFELVTDKRGAQYAIKGAEKFNIYSIPFLLILLGITTCYSYIGIHRLVKEGMALFGSDSIIRWVVRQDLRTMPINVDTLNAFILKTPWLWWMLKIGFPLSTVLEILAPLILISNRFRWIFIAFIIPFHIMNMVLMGIYFWQNTILGILYVNITPLLAPREKKDGHNVIFFDGVCGLCNGFVDWMMARDFRGVYQFAALQGETAKQRFGKLPDNDGEWTIYYAEGDKLYERSTAVLKILIGLGGVFKLAAVFFIVPRPVRDGVYSLIAKNRYAVFGKRDACRLPSPSEKEKFLP